MIRLASILPLAILALIACDRPNKPVAKTEPPPVAASMPPTREDRLRNLARQVILPAFTDLTSACARLRDAAEQFETTPSTVALQSLRTAWTRVAVTRERAPKLDGFAQLPLSFHLWPPRPGALESAIKETDLDQTGAMNRLGASRTGLYAMEYLIFDQRPAYDARRFKYGPPPSPAAEQLMRQPRRRAFVTALAAHLHRMAADTRQVWETTDAERFASGGQASLNALVNAMLETAERLALPRLAEIARTRQNLTFLPEQVPGFTSRSSHLTAKASFDALRQQYTSLSPYLIRFDRELADRLSARFDNTSDGFLRLTDPIEIAATNALHFSAITNLSQRCRDLEITLKTDVASQLGVTITFQGIDGD